MSTPEPQGFAGLGKVDLNKLDDVVTAVWDNRDEVTSTVTFVREHGDDLLALVARLPDLLERTGTALSEAAADTRATARFLTGDGDDSGVQALAESASDALEVCQRELTQVRDVLTSAAELISRMPMMDRPATKLASGVAHLDGIGDQLGTVAQNLRGIGSLLDRAGTGLSRTADRLDGGSSALSSFTK